MTKCVHAGAVDANFLIFVTPWFGFGSHMLGAVAVAGIASKSIAREGAKVTTNTARKMN